MKSVSTSETRRYDKVIFSLTQFKVRTEIDIARENCQINEKGIQRVWYSVQGQVDSMHACIPILE